MLLHAFILISNIFLSMDCLFKHISANNSDGPGQELPVSPQKLQLWDSRELLGESVGLMMDHIQLLSLSNNYESQWSGYVWLCLAMFGDVWLTKMVFICSTRHNQICQWHLNGLIDGFHMLTPFTWRRRNLRWCAAGRGMEEATVQCCQETSSATRCGRGRPLQLVGNSHERYRQTGR